MKILVVEDENIALNGLVLLIKKVEPNAEIFGFMNSFDALEFSKNNQISIAFLDIEMNGLNGIDLAFKLKEYNNNVNIIFTTGYSSYMSNAFDMHASGYLLKPISEAKLKKELDNLRYPIEETSKLLDVKCFGNFEIYANGERLLFKRSKTKELFAYLVDRNGAGMTAKQICAVLFSDDTDDSKNVAYLRQLVLDLKNTLKMVNAEDVFRHQTPYYRIDINLIKCDYLSYLKTGKPDFYGEYMSQYSWADETCAMLQYKNTNKNNSKNG